MKKFLKSKKGIALLATMVVAIAAAVGAYAYFTSTGSDSSTAAVGAAAEWTVDADITANTLYPGQGSNYSSGTVTNAGDGNQQLNQIVATIEAPTLDELIQDELLPDCTAADFALSSVSDWDVALNGLSATLTVNQDIVPDGTYDWSDLSVSMIDRQDGDPGDGAGNQNNCQNATVNLTFDAS
jgi:hypothetical protein